MYETEQMEKPEIPDEFLDLRNLLADPTFDAFCLADLKTVVRVAQRIPGDLATQDDT